MLIFISGISGSGKTTVGKALVDHYNKTNNKTNSKTNKINNRIFKDQDDFFVDIKPKTLPIFNGKTKSNWDCIEAIDWKSLNQWLFDHKHANVVFVGFCLRGDLINIIPDEHIHLSLDDNDIETTVNRCANSRIVSKQLNKKQKCDNDEIMVRQVIIPFYLETLKHTKITKYINVYNNNNRLSVDDLILLCL